MVRQLEVKVWQLQQVQVLGCIVVVPLVEVGCILAFGACKLAFLVVVVSFVEAYMLASVVLVLVLAYTLEVQACKKALVEVVLACIEASFVVVAYILVEVVFFVALEEVVSFGEVVCKLDALVVEVLVCILALVDRNLDLVE